MIKTQFTKKQTWIIFAAILILGFFLRFYGIMSPPEKSIPPGLWFDEALNGLDAYKIHKELNFQFTYPDVFPREGMFLWFLGISTGILGDHVSSMRIVSCIISTLTIIAVFLLASEIYNRNVSLLIMLIFALTRWHVHFGHLIFRTNLIPLFSTLSLLYIIRVKKDPLKIKNLVLGAFFCAGGFYTYLAWYFFFPVIIIAALINIDERTIDSKPAVSFLKFPKKSLAIFVLVFVIFVSPMMLHYLFNPESILSRPAAVSPLNEGTGGAIKEVLKNAKFVFTMFTHSGDHVSKHNTPYRPVFGSFGAVFFWLGVVTLLLSCRKNKFSIVLLCWLFFSSMPSVFSKTDSANMLRNLGACVPAAFMYSLGVFFILAFAYKVYLQNKKIANPVLYLLILISLIPLSADLYDYFFKWKNSNEVKMGFLLHITTFAEKCNELSSEYPVFVISELSDNLAFQYITLNNKKIFTVTPEELNNENFTKEKMSAVQAVGEKDKNSGNESAQQISKQQKFIFTCRINTDPEKEFLAAYPEAKIAGYSELPGGMKWIVFYTASQK